MPALFKVEIGHLKEMRIVFISLKFIGCILFVIFLSFYN